MDDAALVVLREAIEGVNRVKDRFKHDEAVYKRFLDLMNMVREGRKDMNQVCEEVAFLFADHRDLLHWFFSFVDESEDNSSAKPDGKNMPTVNLSFPFLFTEISLVKLFNFTVIAAHNPKEPEDVDP
jgi:histone deacetylase complex regulatory component SIN3